MTDREYVESTVAYLAEHVPWMWRDLLDEFAVSDWERDKRIRPAKIVETLILYGHWYDMNEGYDDVGMWLDRQIVTQGRPDNPCPLVSADWWEERGERKLADLLRQQNEVTT
jgi:hypothetical protein